VTWFFSKCSRVSLSCDHIYTGPWLETPVMFCEIGSTDAHWGRTDAAEVYASVLATVLRLDSTSSSSSSSSSSSISTHDDAAWCTLTPQQRSDATVFMCIGGGHYAPRAGDLARKPGVFVGHMLANYSFDWGEAQGWKTAVKAAAAATRTAFPGCRCVYYSTAYLAYR
jgi:D-aminoacyl-tRNA deacylase